MKNDFKATFLGTNGSCAFNGGKREKYGTNTSCVVVQAGTQTLVFDAGTGICNLHSLRESGNGTLHLFLSHYHADHVEGLLFCPAFFDAAKTVHIYGSSDVQGIVNKIIAPPLSPVGLGVFKAGLHFYTVASGNTLELPGGVAVRAYALSHPGGSLGYRVEYGDKAFCYCNDVELENHKDDEGLRGFTRNADLLVLDSAFQDGRAIPGWGHATPTLCAAWATRVKAKRLALTHYHYPLADEEIDVMEKAATKTFANAFAAADGMRVVI
jgi:phosphoribosyl 1,2-cyclic phosphodiesterase